MAKADWNDGEAARESAAMRIQTYRDESRSMRSRHFDLVSGGRSIDLVAILASILLVAGAACALIAPFASTTVGLARWIH